MNVAVIRRHGEIFVTPVSMKQKYAVGVNNGKVFLNLKRISIAGKVSRRGECRDCRKWKRPIPEKAREEFEKTNPQPPMGKPFHYIETGYKMATGYFAHFLVLSIK